MRATTIVKMAVSAAALVAAVLCCGCADNGVGGAFGKQRYTVNKCGKDGTAADCKTVTIGVGGVEWMAENLNRKPSSGESWCYDNKEYNCDRFGRLYDWEAAQSVCPAGWHLSTNQEWSTLVLVAGWLQNADVSLKSKSGWADNWACLLDGNGTDDYDFSAFPGGYRDPGERRFNSAGSSGHWWTATEYGNASGEAYFRSMGCVVSKSGGMDFVGQASVGDGVAADKANGYSVRCVANSAAGPEVDPKTVAPGTLDYGGQTYKTVAIGTQTWMAENLNYEPDTGNSWCYEDATNLCGQYGRLYDWETAIKVCPAGWRLPFYDDWNRLVLLVGGFRWSADVADKLKSADGWRNGANGTNEYGFSALPGGWRNSAGELEFEKIVEYGVWWYGVDGVCANCPYVSISYNSSYVTFGSNSSENGYSVRCIKDG